MNQFISLNSKLINNQSTELYKAYDEYMNRIQYCLNNFIILRSINEFFSSVDVKTLPDSVKAKINDSLRASDNFTDYWTSKTTIEQIDKDIKSGVFMSKISISALIELVAALDNIMISIGEIYVPNLKMKNGKPYIVSKWKKDYEIGSLTLSYPYIVTRLCAVNESLPLLFSDDSVVPYINQTIQLRHMIIHNGAKFDDKKKSSFFTEKLTNTHDDKSLKFDKNSIDDIFCYHAKHLVNFIVWLDKNAKPRNEVTSSTFESDVKLVTSFKKFKFKFE